MRIKEKDVRIPALRAARDKPTGFILIEDLVDELEAKFEPTGEDAEILEGRQDSKFTQVVRNLVSHRDSSTSIFAQGYADYDEGRHGMTITDAGRELVDQTEE